MWPLGYVRREKQPSLYGNAIGTAQRYGGGTRPVYDYGVLCECLRNGTRVTLRSGVDSFTGVIGYIEREDGSGKCFNVKLRDRDQTIFVKVA